MDMTPWTMLLQILQQVEPVSDANEVIQRHSDEEKRQLEHDQLCPVEVSDESVNVFSGEFPFHPLNEGERQSPEQMKEYFLALDSFCYDLILSDKIEHGDKGAAMYPDTQKLDNEGSLLILHDAFREKDPQTPEPNHNNTLEGQGNEMEPRKEQLCMQVAFVLMQQYTEIKVQYNQYLSYYCQLTKVPDISIIVVHVANKHDTVDNKKNSKMPLLWLVSLLHFGFYRMTIL